GQSVSANLFGLFGDGRAVYRVGTGCTTAPAGAAGIADLPPFPQAGQADIAAPWPAGERAEPSPDPAIGAILDDVEMTGPGMRAVVVVRDGRNVGERYGEGFDAT